MASLMEWSGLATGKINLLEHPIIETFFELKWWKIWPAYSIVMLAFLSHTLAACGYAIMEFGHLCTEEQRVRAIQDLYTEEKAKVVAAVWGDRTYSILCTASCFPPG